MANSQKTQQQLVVEAFRMMIRDGDAVRTRVSIPLQTGGVLEKEIYKVKPR